ncbi:hypothetical protein ACHWQZ_G008780 [Mnemiopsis leidyi]
MSLVGTNALCRRCFTFLRASTTRTLATQSSEHEKEVQKFDVLSSGWWKDDKDPLYLMNNVRIPLLKSLAREIDVPSPEILDVGCGGGYLAEELAKQRFSVTAIDPSEDMIKIATKHAQQFPGELDLQYQCATVAEVMEQFDIVVSSEVVEHVPCVASFVSQCADRVRPGGGLMFTTINRTVQSWLFGILLAEHVAGLVPPGTHEYHKLVPPHTLTGVISDSGFDIVTVTGLGFNPLTRQWRTSSDLSINYAVTAIKRNLNECNEDDFDDNYEIR